MQKRRKRIDSGPKDNRISPAVFIVPGILFIVGVMFSFLVIITKIISGDERKIYLASDSSIGTGRVMYPEGVEGTYYESLQSSMDAYWTIKDIDGPAPTQENEIISFGDDFLFSIYADELYLLGPAVRCTVVECKSGLYSCPIYFWCQPVLKTYFEKEMSSEEDKVAISLMTSYSHREATMQANDGLPIFYGVGTEERVNHLSIMGKKPDKIFSYTFEGNIYYFWYYMDGSEFAAHFDKYTDLDQMTVEDAVAYFEIRFVEGADSYGG